MILNQIAARAHFLIVLTPSALERCNEPGDWLRREIEHAIELQRNVVPVMFEGFNFGAMSQYLTGQMAVLSQYNGVEVPRGYFTEAMTRLRTRFLSKPLDMILHPPPPDDAPVVKQRQTTAGKWTRVTESHLSADEYFERGFKNYHEDDFQRAIADCTQAIDLNPQHGGAYNLRGAARYEIDDFEGAIADYTESLRIDPAQANVLTNRGHARFESNDFEGAMADFTDSLRLDPDNADANYGLGNIYWHQGNLDSAAEAYAEVLRIEPERTDACVNCGEIFFELETYELSLDFFTTARALAPDDPFALAGLGISAHALGDTKSAKAYWKSLMAIDERYRDAAWTGQEAGVARAVDRGSAKAGRETVSRITPPCDPSPVGYADAPCRRIPDRVLPVAADRGRDHSRKSCSINTAQSPAGCS